MKREHYLAAEIYGYSYDHYNEKIKMGHERFSKYMPRDIEILEQSEKENWSEQRMAKALEIEIYQVKSFKDSFARAKKIVDQENAARSYIAALEASVESVVSNTLTKIADTDIEPTTLSKQLVAQILYCTSDFGHLLAKEEKELYEYGQILRDYNMGS